MDQELIFNPETGQNELLDPESARAGLQSGKYHYLLNNPDGHPVSMPYEEAKQALKEGFTQPSIPQLKQAFDYSKYTSSEEQTKAFFEGAARGATLGLSTAVEKAFGVDPEKIRKREEFNPSEGAELLGLVGSSLIPGLGAANVLERAGAAGAKALGLGAGTGLASKIGSAAAKGAIENAIYAGGNEAHKAFLDDPNQSVESALADIGIGGLIGGVVGGGFGAISPLWKATSESKLGQALSAVKEKVNATGHLPASAVDEIAERAGIELTPEMRAGLGDNPESRAMFQELQESLTKGGKKAQEGLKNFKLQTQNSILQAIGKTPEQIDALGSVSENELGGRLQQSLISEVKKITDPISESFDKVRKQYSEIPIAAEDKALTGDLLANVLKEKGYGLVQGSPQGKLINRAIESLDNATTVEDLRKISSALNKEAQASHMWDVGKSIRNVFNDAEESIVERTIGKETPEILTQHQLAKGNYRNSMKLIDDLNDRLRVGEFSGPSSFLERLKEMSPETVLRRLSPKNDAGLLKTLTEQFPETAQTIRENYLNQALDKSMKRLGPEDLINSKAFAQNISDWSPELRDFVLPKEAFEKIKSVEALINRIPEKLNPSGTAKTLDMLGAKSAAGVGAMLSYLTHHNPIVGLLTGLVGGSLTREIPDAMKLSLLKFLGDNKPIQSAAFKSMVEMANATLKGESAIAKAAKGVFKAGKAGLAQPFQAAYAANEKQNKKLKDKLEQLWINNEDLYNIGKQVDYYLPDHGGAISATAIRTVEYLRSLRPDTTPPGPLDQKLVPSKPQEARFNSALAIAQTPLLAVEKIKTGTLTTNDVIDLQAMYPGLYQKLVDKLMEEVVAAKAEGKEIPYRAQMSLSLFLSQPMTATLQPASIQSAQEALDAEALKNQQQQAQMKMPKRHNYTGLMKLPGMFQTTGQAAATRNLGKFR